MAQPLLTNRGSVFGQFAVSADGQRFLMDAAAQQQPGEDPPHSSSQLDAAEGTLDRA